MLTDKQSIQAAISKAIDLVAKRVENISEEQAFDQVIIDKWSVAEQLIHLNVATQAVGTGLGLPKIALRAFGSSRNGSRTYDELVALYQEKLKAIPPTTGFEPERRGKSWAEIRDKWKSLDALLTKNLAKWDEKTLDKRQLPHPLMGKITVREMLYFTHYHILHHGAKIDELVGRMV
jgi:hypothetical protein